MQKILLDWQWGCGCEVGGCMDTGVTQGGTAGDKHELPLLL